MVVHISVVSPKPANVKIESIHLSNRIRNMAGPSVQFKQLLCKHDRMSRDQILYKLSNWLMQQHPTDPYAGMCSSTLQMLCNDNGYQSEQDFMNNHNWLSLRSYDHCVSLQRIVDANLSIPQNSVPSPVVQPVTEPHAPKPRRSIPKKIRSLVWKAYFGDSMSGSCFCCKKNLEALDEWHAGHIVSHANGGKDGVANLRPVCISCNLSMGTENMDDFKARCYSS